MKTTILQKLEENVKEKRSRRQWYKVVVTLAAVVTFVTTMILMLPATALEGEVYCGYEEHVHSDECYTTNILCGYEKEGTQHVHGADCYESQSVLTCTLEETEGHTHTDTCYETQDVFVCEITVLEHFHEEACYEKVFTCQVQEHSHSLICYANKEADVETAEKWESTIPAALSGDYREDLVAVANSQIGYAESTDNYEVATDAEGVEYKKGYTRYGEWYGAPYGDWNKMFVAFSLHYAGISEEVMPRAASCSEWTTALSEAGMYTAASAGSAEVGDLVFLDVDQDTTADRLGIICEVTEEEISVIEGDSSDCVAKNTYKLAEGMIVGYGKLPVQEDGQDASGATATAEPTSAPEPTVEPTATPDATEVSTDNQTGNEDSTDDSLELNSVSSGDANGGVSFFADEDVSNVESGISLSVPMTVEIAKGEEVLIPFVPQVTHTYTFRTANWDYCVYGVIYDENGTELWNANKGRSDESFAITQVLEKDVTYYLGVGLNSSSSSGTPTILITYNGHELQMNDEGESVCSLCNYKQIPITIGEPIDVSIEAGQQVDFVFTADYYHVYALESTSTCDTFAALYYDYGTYESYVYISGDDNSGVDDNFRMEEWLYTGSYQYYLKVFFADDTVTDTITVSVDYSDVGHTYSLNENDQYVCYCGNTMPEILTGETISVKVAGSRYENILFTPEFTHTYVIESSSEFGTYGGIYHNDSYMTGDSSSGENDNFKMEVKLEAGERYRIGVCFDGGNVGDIPVTVNVSDDGHDYVVNENGEFVCGCNNTANSIKTGEIFSVTLSANETILIPFIPEYTHEYAFYSISNSDTYGYIYAADGETVIAEADYGGINRNFFINCSLEKGIQYYLAIKFSNTNTSGSLPVRIELNNHDYIKSSDKEYICSSCGKIVDILAMDEMYNVSVLPGGYITKIPFETKCSHEYTVFSDSASTNDLYGYIYDAEGNLIVGRDSGASSNNFLITYDLEKDSTYYIGVKSKSLTVKGKSNISINLGQHDYSTEDNISFACKNCNEEAEIITEDIVSEMTIIPGALTEVVFVPNMTHYYAFGTYNYGSNSPVAYIYNAEGVLVNYASVSGMPMSTLLEEGKVYYMGIKLSGSAAGTVPIIVKKSTHIYEKQEDGTYVCACGELQQEMEIDVQSKISAQGSTSDMVIFKTEYAHKYSFDVVSNSYSYLEIYDEDMNVINSSGGYNYTVSADLEGEKLYYVRAYFSSNYSTGDISVTPYLSSYHNFELVDNKGVCACGEEAEAVIELNGQIEYEGSVSARISFTPEANHSYIFTCNDTLGYGDLYLYDDNGTELAHSTGDGDICTISANLEAGKEYYFDIVDWNTESDKVIISLAYGSIHKYVFDGTELLCICGDTVLPLTPNINIPMASVHEEKVEFTFVLAYTHLYSFEPINAMGSVSLYDSNNNLVAYYANDEYSIEGNYQNILLNAGELYTFKVSLYNWDYDYDDDSAVEYTYVRFEYVDHDYDYDEEGKLRCTICHQLADCGDGVYWTFDEESGTLTIYGEGAMYNYYYDFKRKEGSAPWYTYISEDKIKTVVIEEGVTYVGNYAFSGCEVLEDIHLPDSLETLGAYAFSNCSNLKDIDISNTKLVSIPQHAFNSCSGLKSIVLPSSVTSIDDGAFSACSSLTDVVFVDNQTGEETDSNVMIIGSDAFSNCRNLTSMEVSADVQSIGDNAFYNCVSLTQFQVADGQSDTVCTIGKSAFEKCTRLSDVTFLNKVAEINDKTFYDCDSLTNIVIPDSVTTINKSAFSNCGSLVSVEISGNATTVGESAFENCDELTTVTWDVINAGSVSTTAFSKCLKLATITVGENVDTLDSSLIEAIPKNCAIEFAGPNLFVLNDSVSSSTAAVDYPLCSLASGEYYVDSNGVLYRLEDDATATLIYCSPAALSLSVPKEIQVDGISYAVTSVGKYATRCARNLSEVIFENPDSITSIEALAFADCTKLASVNDLTDVSSVEALFGQGVVGVNAFYNTALSNNLVETKEILEVKAADGPVLTIETAINESTNGFTYYTGQYAETTISISNPDNSVGNHKIRIYFQFSDDGFYINRYVGETIFIPDNSGNYYSGKYLASSVENVYYIEVEQVAGATLSLGINSRYPSPSSGGGDLLIWGAVLTEEEAAEVGSGLTAYDKCHHIKWITKPDTFPITKQQINAEDCRLVGDGTGGGIAYINGLSFNMTIAREDDTLSGIGKDYMHAIEYEDILTLPKGASWRQGLLTAIENHQYRVSPYIPGSIFVDIGDEEIELCELTSSSVSNTQCTDVSVCLTENKDNIIIKWTYKSTSSSEMPFRSTQITYGPEAIYISNPSEGQEYVFNNSVKATQHFTYSSVRTQEAAAESEALIVSKPDYVLTKSQNSTYERLGNDHEFYVSVYNNGVLSYDDLEYVGDNLDTMFYIKPENIQKMFDDDYQNPYSSLELTISNPVLCTVTPDDNQTVIGTDGNTYYISNANTGVNTKYNSVEYEDSVVTVTDDWIKFAWDEGSLVMTTSSYSYTIGEGLTIEDAFDEIGFIVTPETQYSLKWTYNDDFVLYGGQQIDYEILSTFKDSFMYTNEDKKNKLDVNKVQYSNLAYTNNKKSDTVSGTFSYDFELLKSYSVNSTTPDETTVLLPENVIDYNLSVKFSGSSEYDIVPLVDHLQGGQVLMVLASQNEHLSEEPYNLEPELVNQREYYILDQKMVYKNVVVGGLLTDSIIVSEFINENEGTVEESTPNDYDVLLIDEGLSTIIKWYLTDVDTSSYNKSISYKAIVSPERAGVKDSTFYLGNEVWLNDHQSHRLYYPVGQIPATRLEAKKDIVVERSASGPSDDELTNYLPVDLGDKVTYRFTFKNYDVFRYTLTGKMIYDVLPASIDYFWKKGDISIEYVASDGTILEDVVNGDHWNIMSQNKNGEEQQFIRWDDDFCMYIEDVAYIYVTVNFPSDADLWQRYLKQNINTRLENNLVVNGKWSTVYHDLTSDAEAILQKGVYRTGVITGDGGYSDFGYNTSVNSRLNFSYDDIFKKAVLYYVVLYNSGQNRLYIDTIEDTLPSGFTYDRCVSGYNIAALETDSSELVMVSDPSVKSVEWKSARLNDTYTAENPVKVSFKIQYSATLSYDELLGKYYLLPGEGIKFAYAVRPNSATSTSATSATNKVEMQYYSYNNGKVKVSEDVKITGDDYVNTIKNDGSCYVINSSDKQFLASDVTLTQGKILPGITKSVKSINGSTNKLSYAEPDDIVEWDVKLHNDGDYPISDYTVIDVMQSPYQFTGDVKYKLNYSYSYNGSFTSNKSISTTLFSIVSRTDTSITIKDYKGTEHTLDYDNYSIIPVTMDNKEFYINVKFSTESETNNEVLTIQFSDHYASIPEGGSAELLVSTVNLDTTKYFNRMYVNTAYFTPTQLYDTVYEGKEVVYDSQNTIRNSSAIAVASGYVTTSLKTVTEVDNADNSATSLTVSGEDNYIILPDAEKEFIYTLQINTAQEASMEKLVIIDNLPEPDDHSTFIDTDYRFSEFKVSLSDKPNFVVTISDVNGNATILSADQYSLEFSEKTEFTDGDWDGSEMSGWNGKSEGARSFRIILNDSTGNLLPKGSKVTVAFQAKVDDDEAEDGMIAWNSFGYHYKLVNVTQELEAAPLNVGVAIKSIPKLQKKLIVDEGTPYVTSDEETFRYVIFADDSSILPEDCTEAMLGETLMTKNRSFTYVEVKVPAGKSESDVVLLDNMNQYTYNEGVWVQDETLPWNWVERAVYTVVELPPANQDEFEFYSIGDLDTNSYTFKYDPLEEVTIVNTNRKVWDFSVQKVDSADKAIALGGAVFGLYSPNSADQMTYVDYEAYGLEEAPSKTLTITDDDGATETTYYLTQMGMTGDDGVFTWSDLTRSEYYLVELKAPEEYICEQEPILVESLDYEDYEDIEIVTVTNVKTYALPNTGGVGARNYMVSGLLLLTLAVFMYISNKRREHL